MKEVKQEIEIRASEIALIKGVVIGLGLGIVMVAGIFLTMYLVHKGVIN